MNKTNFKIKTKVLNQTVSFTVLLLAAGFLFTGCPQKPKEQAKPVYYTVTLVSEGGSLTSNPALQDGTALKNSEISFTASPSNPSTHEVDKWAVTGGDILEGGSTGSTSAKVKITADTKVKVTFKEKSSIPFVQIPKAVITGVNPTYGLPGTEDWRKGVFIEGRTVHLSAYALSKMEVPYWLWKEVYDWAVTNGYTFANKGKEGIHGTDGAEPTEAGKKEPVTNVSWRDCIVWCNAYTEKEKGIAECVYLKSASDPAVLKDATDGGACDAAYTICLETCGNGAGIGTEQYGEEKRLTL